jgi:putative aldouronate transport system substrate-binding protein
MKLKKLLSLLLAFAMIVAMLTACGSTEQDTTPTDQSTPASSSGEDDADATVPDDGEDDDDDEGEMKSIIVELFAPSIDSEAGQDIEDALNVLTEERINVHVTLHYNDASSIATTITTGIPAGEQMDLLCFNPVGGCTLGTLVAQNQVIDMTPYLEEYAPQVLDLLSDYLPATTFDGKIMGVSNLRQLNESFWLTMNADVLEELGLTEKAESCDNWTTYEEIMQAVVDNTDLAGMGPNDGNGSLIENYAFFVGEENWSDSFAFDNLGDQYSLIYVDTDTDTVINYYSTDEYKSAVTLAHKWYEEGLIYKDSATTEQTRDAQLSSNLSFSISGQGGPATPVNKISSTQHNVLCKQLATPVISSSNLVKFGYCMPVTCAEPEAAAKFLEMMYTDSDVMNLLLWGIEGRDWVLNDEGEATYPEGVDASTVKYHGDEDMFANCYIAYPWEGLGGDFRETSWEELQNTPVSKYVGLTVDTSSVADQITACYNASQQYRAILNCGQADPETVLPEFLEALEAAGVQDIIDCYQSQLDAWLAENG